MPCSSSRALAPIGDEARASGSEIAGGARSASGSDPYQRPSAISRLSRARALVDDEGPRPVPARASRIRATSTTPHRSRLPASQIRCVGFVAIFSAEASNQGVRRDRRWAHGGHAAGEIHREQSQRGETTIYPSDGKDKKESAVGAASGAQAQRGVDLLGTLEIRFARKGNGGSNPFPSAIFARRYGYLLEPYQTWSQIR